MANIILSSLALILIIAYVVVIMLKFNPLWSLSESYYLFNNLKSKLGLVFTGLMVVLAALTLPAFIQESLVISSWSKYVMILPILGCLGMIGMGIAPLFCKTENRLVNNILSIITCVLLLGWVFSACYRICFIIVPIIPLVWTAIHATFRDEKSAMLGVEMLSFFTTFTALLYDGILIAIYL